MNLDKKVVVVTGASSGIGFKFAQMAEQSGYSVVWCSRNMSSNNISVGENSIKLDLDVSCEKSVSSAFESISERYKKLYALVNCAGAVAPESMLSTSLDNWNETIAVNLTGTFLCCKYATPLLKKSNDGRIINIASTAALTPRPGWSAYAAAKSGVVSFSNAIAEELSIYNIKIFVLCPGRTATPLRTILAPKEDPKTIMQPEAVAEVVMYCLSKEAAVLEGQPIIVRDRF